MLFPAIRLPSTEETKNNTAKDGHMLGTQRLELWWWLILYTTCCITDWPHRWSWSTVATDDDIISWLSSSVSLLKSYVTDRL